MRKITTSIIVLALLVEASVAARATMNEVVIADFSKPQESYTQFFDHRTPAAKLSMSWREAGSESKGCIALDYEFDPGTGNCQCAAWGFDGSVITGKENSLAFRAKGQQGAVIRIRLVDATKQVHCFFTTLADDGWTLIQLPISGLRSRYHGEAENDGVVRFPLRDVQIGVTPDREFRGTLLIDNVVLGAGSEEVTVDFKVDNGPATYRASGILHGLSVDNPKGGLVSQLKPGLLRNSPTNWWGKPEKTGALEVYVRAKRMGSKSEMAISDSYGYGDKTAFPGDNGDWAKWEDLCVSLAKQAKEKGDDFQFDIWNEPDINMFWKRDRDRLFETWKRGVLKVRSVDPKAIVVGPSIAIYSREWLESFLLYAKENNVLPDILSWHEMSYLDFDYKNIPAHIECMRSFMRKNDIPVIPVEINEFCGERLLQVKPGAQVWFFAAMERAKVAGACRTCTPDEKPGCWNCFTMTLAGLLTPELEPRSVWWAFKGYADVTGRLVGVEPGASVNGVAGADGYRGEARVLLGREGGPSGDVTLRLKNINELRFLMPGGSVRVVAEKIRNTDWRKLDKPAVVLDSHYQIRGNELTIALPGFGADDAYVVSVRPQ